MTEQPTTPDATDRTGPAPAAHDQPSVPPALVDLMSRGWDETDEASALRPLECAEHTARRREQLSQRFPGEVLVIPTGGLKVRANDTFHEFRPGSDFFWLTGEVDPDTALVMTPREGGGHDAALYRSERRSRERGDEFWRDRTYGELWTGRRRSHAETEVALGLPCRDLEDLPAVLDSVAGGRVRVLRGMDERIDAAVPGGGDADTELAAALGDMRLVKDGFELEQIQDAVDATVRGFVDVVRRLPLAVETSERAVEGVFGLRARVEGNGVGYSTIAAAGPHACTLHWTRNDGPVRPGELLLLDAGVENRWLYTADVTRTVPVSGRFTPLQRRLYDIVIAAQDAAFQAIRPGARFLDYHDAANRVLAEGLAALGILPVPAEEALRPESQVYKRYTLHGIGHMLGLDVHDCAAAPDERYRDGVLQEGYVLTVEPGLYFQPDDLTVPEELRGIGIRVEDDVVVTADGCRILTAALPRRAEEVEAWMDRHLEPEAGWTR